VKYEKAVGKLVKDRDENIKGGHYIDQSIAADT